MNKVIVVGSLNVDLTVYAPHFPVAGETVIGSTLRIGMGGKGSNQATLYEVALYGNQVKEENIAGLNAPALTQDELARIDEALTLFK